MSTPGVQLQGVDWGTCVLETDIDRLVLTRLRYWLPSYLDQAERERDLPNGEVARPNEASYQNALEDNEFPDGRLPAVLATTGRTEGEPRSMPGRAYGAMWRVQVSCIVRGRIPRETREVAAVFGGAVRRILIHQQIELDAEVRWQESEIIPVPDQTDRGRWLAAAVNRFTVYADVALDGDGPWGGPGPPPDGWEPWDPEDPDPGVDQPEAYPVTTTINAR
jgi:hypothetical protein